MDGLMLVFIPYLILIIFDVIGMVITAYDNKQKKEGVESNE